MHDRARSDTYAILLLAAICAALYLALPRAGDIWMPDAARHALNGAFVLDLLKAAPLHDPVGFAYEYYRQWPALTILFYPPLFQGVMAVFYAVFGVSEATALLPQFIALFGLACGGYTLSRTWMDPPAALAVALLTIGTPEIAFWGRQIVLDIPAYAFIVWAAVFHLRFLRGGTVRNFYLAVLLVLAAAYTKYNAVFFALPLAVSVVIVRGWRFVISPPAIKAALAGGVLLLPLAVVFFKFAAYNLAQATHDAPPRWSSADLLFYFRLLPSILTWPVVAGGVLGVALWIVRPDPRFDRPSRVLMMSWLVIGFGFYTAVALKEPRHILMATFPLLLAAVQALDRLPLIPALKAVVPVAAAGAVFAVGVIPPPPAVTGYREAALEVAAIAPRESNVAFWGRLDGTFIYAMRAYSGRSDLGVVRLDKVLLSDLNVALERGFTEKAVTPDEIATMLRDLHAQYVVVQPSYGSSIGVIGALNTALQSDKFVEVKRIPMTSNRRLEHVTELVIYRLKEDVPAGRVAPPMDVKLINRSL